MRSNTGAGVAVLSKPEERVERVLRAIRQILQKTTEHARQTMRDHQLTVPQCLCLRLLAQPQDNSWTVAALSRKIQLSVAATSRVVDRLVREGLVSRNQDASDRRRWTLQLTAAGNKRLKKLPPTLQTTFVNRYQQLVEEDQARLLESLETLVRLMGAENLDLSEIAETDRPF